jgi:two-component system LytT family sensor kinase
MALTPLRAGLTADTARPMARHLRKLLGTPAVAITAGTELLAWHGIGMRHHSDAVGEHAAGTLDSRRTRVLAVDCARRCPIRHVVTGPLVADQRVVGVLGVYARSAPPTLVRAVTEISGWISINLELADLDRSRSLLAEAALLPPRAQPGISPHFMFNSLTAIMSFVRTDPDYAKDLLQAFADVARYSLRRDAGLATLGEELAAINPYLILERARFADRLRVTVDIAADVESVAVPVMCLQPLVDNAIRHGIERKAGPGRITIMVTEIRNDVEVSVVDDGMGMDPQRIRRILGDEDGDGTDGGSGVGTGSGVGSVHRRLRRAFGDRYGLAVETTPGAGTRISMRVPKDRLHPPT